VKPEPPIDPSNPVNPPPDPSLQWFRGDYHTESDLKPLRYSSTNATGLLSTLRAASNDLEPPIYHFQRSIDVPRHTKAITYGPAEHQPCTTDELVYAGLYQW
jgi:hypothetical protein